MSTIDQISSLDRDLFVRRCVACGYDGALLRDGQAPRCARCGCDLRERPARSYAEMEGFVGLPGSEVTTDRDRPARLVQHWLAFLFFVMVGFTLLVYLLAAAMP